jgi:hypothetical protein
MNPIQLSGLLAQPLALRIRDWRDAGKLDEDALDDALPSDARAWIDHPIALEDWAALDEIEALVDLAASQLGGEAGLVEWADELVAGWLLESPLADVLARGRWLVDGPGYVLSEAGAALLSTADWRYEGGRASFGVRFEGLGDLSPALKALLGACLARLADAAQPDRFDVRFDGVDGDVLVVFGARLEQPLVGGDQSEHRLHRAALIP